jgi:DNA (cytosine-5)-methyltransferase 1
MKPFARLGDILANKKSFTFIDLFAGIGGFHQALEQLGGECVFASEIDADAKKVYELNFSTPLMGVSGDIIPLTEPSVSAEIPQHDVLCAGFPCQPFSKGGSQKGVNEARGTLFFNIAKVIESRRPKIVLLENVRNLVGPKHLDTFHRIIQILRDFGYLVSDNPIVLSPQNIPLNLGGRPQSRDRLYIFAVRKDLVATRDFQDNLFWLSSKPSDDVNSWDLDTFPFAKGGSKSTKLSSDRSQAVELWKSFIDLVGKTHGERRFPGFPIWEFALRAKPEFSSSDPEWKIDFLKKNSAFYVENKKAIDDWRKRNSSVLKSLPLSYKKFEWQAGNLALKDTLLQFRPSGLRFKVGSHFPALVAINQTSYVPRLNRYLSVKEASYLQGFSDKFSFGSQSDQTSFKQLGNAVCVGVVGYVFKEGLAHYSLSVSDLSRKS